MEVYFKGLTPETASTEQLVEDLMTLVEDAEAVVENAQHGIAEPAKEQLIVALEQVKSGCLTLREKAAARARATDRLIRKHPYGSVGIALALGLLVGLLTSRTSDSEPSD